MPKSSLAELVFAVFFAVITTGIAGFLVTNDSQESARVRLHEIDRLKAERTQVQIQSIRNWVGDAEVSERRAEVEEVVFSETRRSWRDFREKAIPEEVSKVYRALLSRMDP